MNEVGLLRFYAVLKDAIINVAPRPSASSVPTIYSRLESRRNYEIIGHKYK